MKATGAALQESRKATGLTQAQMAAKMHVTQATVSLWEKDPSGMTLKKLKLWHSFCSPRGKAFAELVIDDLFLV